MNRTAAILFFAIIFHSSLFSQENLEPYTPTVYNQRGLDYIGENPDYEKAEKEFAKIHPNDTLYNQSFYNRIFCLRSAGEYEKALELIEEGIALNNEYIVDIYVNKVRCLEALGMQDSVYAVLDKAENIYPYNYSLKIVRGQMLEAEGRYKEALEIYQQCVLDEPRNPSHHYSLANLALQSGAVAYAVLPIAAALTISPEREGNLGILSQGNRIVSSKPDVEYTDLDHNIFGEKFSDINDLLSNYVALDDAYIVPGDFQENFIKQLHLIIAESELTDGFFSKVYLKPFKKILETGKFSQLASLICFSSTNESHKAILNKNIESLIAFNAEFKDSMEDSSEQREPMPGLTDQKVDFLFNDDGTMIGMCQYDAKKGILIGPAVYFNRLGSVEYEGSYDDNGYAIGVWKWYHNNGVLARESNFVEGKLSGISKYYTERGGLSNIANYKDDQLNGILESYKWIGYKYEDVNYKNGLKNGEMIGYHPDNSIYYKYVLKDGKYNGPFTVYFDNGSIELEGHFVDDLYQGEVIRYFRNGQISYREQYKKGVLHGSYESYFQNGLLHNAGHLKDGDKIGEWKEFNSAGALIELEEYDDKGKVNGPTKNYDHLGRIETEYIKKKGSIKELVNYDENGGVISSFKRKGKVLNFENLRVNGELSSIGRFEDDQREGVWKFYNNYGKLYQESVYKEGNLEGTVKDYYNNQELSTETNYKNNMKNGLYTEYFLSGAIKFQAYYKDDKLEGRAIRYNQLSNIEMDAYYISGMQEGECKYYNSDGSIYLMEEYENGYLMSGVRYAHNGDVIGSFSFTDGSGVDEYYYTADKKQLMGRQEYVGGNKNGPFKRYHINGKPRIMGGNVNDSRNGEWTYYYFNGNLSSKGNYEYGTLTGAWEEYYLDGTVSKKYEYVYGRYNGDVLHYHRNGELSMKVTYKNGVLDGTCDIYNYDGEFLVSLMYENDVFTGYTYLDQNNKLKELIAVPKGTGTIEAFFPNGNKSISYTLKTGFIHGPYTTYYSNGSVDFEAIYEEGFFNGKVSRYFNNGSQLSESEYIEDSRHGEANFYFPNGQLKRQENWVIGEQHGTTIHYDEDGNIIHTIRYIGDVPHELK